MATIKTGPRQWVNLLSGLGVGLAGSAILFRKFFFLPKAQFFWADEIDAKLIYWIVNWGYHILFERKDPLNFWNANSYFPETNALAHSDSLLSLQLFFAPLRAAGFTPLTAMYLALAACLVAGCILTFAALRRLGDFNLLETAFITFAAHFGLSFSSYLNHYQLFGFAAAPAFFIHTFLYFRDYKKTDLLTACVLFVAGTCFATYFAPMTAAVLSISLLPLLVRGYQTHGLAGLTRKIGWQGFGIAAVSAAGLYIVQVQPYLSRFNLQSGAFMENIEAYSASPLSLFTQKSVISLWYGPPQYTLTGQWEFAYFPGYLLLVLGFGYLLLRILRWASVHESVSLCADTWVCFFLAAWLLSMGPGIKPFNLPSPLYHVFGKLIPGLANIRAPGRFGIWLGLALAVFSVLLLRRLRLKGWQTSLAQIVLLAALVIESLPDHPVYPVVLDPYGIYSGVGEVLGENTPLIELPVVGSTHLNTIRKLTRQLAGSTLHWGKLVAGYGALSSSSLDELLELDSQLQQGADTASMIEFGARLGVNHYLVYLPVYPEPQRQQWRELAVSPGACLYFEKGNFLFLGLNQAVCAQP